MQRDAVTVDAEAGSSRVAAAKRKCRYCARGLAPVAHHIEIASSSPHAPVDCTALHCTALRCALYTAPNT